MAGTLTCQDGSEILSEYGRVRTPAHERPHGQRAPGGRRAGPSILPWNARSAPLLAVSALLLAWAALLLASAAPLLACVAPAALFVLAPHLFGSGSFIGD